ncbi:MAG: hypothetical protein M0Q12_13890 [Synergistaceae bacterium]|jgi:hypothetical protein|nr:hypothetical protein [Synergistaceae bacterium]
MKKLMFASFLFLLFQGMTFQAVAQNQLQDKIELSREGGTTRATPTNSNILMTGSSALSAPATVDAYVIDNVVSVAVQNFRGGAWVEVVGEGGSRQSFFQVFDMGFEVLNLSGLANGNYTIRVIQDDATVYSGKFKKGQ